MPQRGNRGGGSSSYVFKFVGTAALLVLGTLVLVLYVLPERYVLSSGFREGNLNLPNPRIPFEPAPPLRIAAIPGIPQGVLPPSGAPGADTSDLVPRGPAELFWERVLPLLEAGRYREAIPLFTDYLNRFPGDLGVRREYAITLAAAGQRDRAVPIFRELLEHEDDEALHLLLARTFRDAGRVDEASAHYEMVLGRHPGDVELALEWARALSWIAEHDRAADVLGRALEGARGSVPLRAELVRVHYYAGRIEEAQALLDTLTEEEIVEADLVEVRANLRTWLTPPADTIAPPPPPTLLERAVRARDDDDLAAADSLFQATLEAEPESVEAWRAHADFLQYEREDFAGALDALKEVERLGRQGETAGAAGAAGADTTGADTTGADTTGVVDPALQYRMAQLEIWTDRTAEARARLEALLSELEGVPSEDLVPAAPTEPPAPAESPSPSRAAVLTLLGDLHRWNGERLPAVRRYQAALEADPEHEGAEEGLDILRDEVSRFFAEIEEPGVGGVASTFIDTDDFRRYQAGGTWTGIHDAWVWSTRSGGRWLEGFEPGGGLGSREGLFAELEGARWWRWGTVRTGLHLALQNVRSNSVDLGVGASARFVGAAGRRTDLRGDHEPAFAATNTLQSVATNVWQSRVSVAHAEPLSERWSGSVTAEVATLDHRELAGAEANTRIQGAVGVSRTLSSVFTAGLSGRALSYGDAAPTVTTALPDATALRLYWDPELSLSVGPHLQMIQPLSASWDLTARANPGIAYIQERGRTSELVPDLSARVGLLLDGSEYQTRIEAFYGQGRFSGYRAYGVDVSFSARGFLGPGFGGS